MLVTLRYAGESLVLPSLDIEVVVVEVRGDKVRIGIDAPDDIPIYRREVWRKLCREHGVPVVTRLEGVSDEDHEGT
jgi:carbon storage regulator